MSDNKFNYSDTVIHKKTGNDYTINDVPKENRRLEYCNEPFYEYTDSHDGIRWYRCKSEFEDGRFELKPIDSEV